MVVNPTAGKTQGRTTLFPIINEFHRAGYSVTVHPTQARNDARETLRKSAADYELIVSCGGDGTLNEVIDGVMSCERCDENNRPKIGFIPVGTTNDLAASLNIPKSPVEAARRFIEGPPVAYDIGRFNSASHFVYVACFGAFSDIPYITPQTTKNVLGHAAYIMEGVRHLPEIRPAHMRVEWEGGVVEDDFIFGSVMNSTSIAGIVKLKPEEVCLNDGLFDVILIKNSKSLLDLQRVATKIIRQDYNDRYLYFFKSSSISFSSDTPQAWCLDGEDGGMQQNVHIENLPQAIHFAAGGAITK